MKSSLSFSNRKGGSAFITVILFTFMLSVLIGSIITWSRNERLLTVRNAHWLEARNAAEALAEYGFAQVSNQFNGHSQAPTFDPGQPSSSTNYPLVMPAGSTGSSANSFWDRTSGHVDLSTSSATKLELIASTGQSIPASGFYYVDPSVVNNQTDPLKGQYIKRTDVFVVARASVLSPEGGPPVTAYVEETISARGAPLFANAIFYSNVDLEIFPGPTMTITGPVRCNGNVYVSSQGSTLSFQGPVSLSGNLYHAWANSNTASEGSGGETLGTGTVNFVNSANSAVAMYRSVGTVNGTSYGTTWVDSTMGKDAGVSGLANLQAITTSNAQVVTDFRQQATQLWNGNVQTAAMGVQVNNPISFSQIIDSAGDTPDPHSIIDPPATSAYLNSDPTYTTAKQSVESQKFSTQAGLYIKVTETAAITDLNGNPIGPPSAVIQVYGNGAATAPQEGNTLAPGPNGGPLIGTYTTQTANGLVKFIPYTSTTSGTSTTTASTYALQGNGKFTRTTTSLVTPTSQVNYSTGSTTATVTGGSSTASSTTTSNISSIGSILPTTTSSMGSTTSSTATTISAGLFDQRRQMGIDLVQIDMSVLTKLVKDMESNSATAKADSAAMTYVDSSGTTQVWGWTTTGGTPWNGGIYVDVEAPNAVAGTSAQSASVILVNGTVASGSSLIPNNGSSNGYGSNANGLTIATNAPVYIQGNFNADGSVTGSSATTPDDGNNDTGSTPSAESPACIAADAVTLLSPGFSTSASLTNKPAASGTVEVAAALLTGITTTSNGASSGGAHNLPRFLESWSGTVAIRGSLTCLYASKVATQPWSTDYYGAPPRQWGFDNQFKNGHYPPLVPKVMSYRRVTFTDMSAAAYAAAKHLYYPSEY